MIRQFRSKTTALAAAVALTAVVLAPASAIAQASRGITVPVVGTVVGGGTFAGTATVTRFVNNNGQLTALGLVNGILTNAAGVATTVVSTFAAPIGASQIQATCDILHLDLGPLNLNLLGLQVDLSRIVLDITAQAGAGNLLGNLLCAVAGLLDDPGGDLARLLNQILGILR